MPKAKEKEPVPVIDDRVVKEFWKLCDPATIDSLEARLNKMDEKELATKVDQCRAHPSLPCFLAYLKTQNEIHDPFVFGVEDAVGEVGAFELWCQAETTVGKPPVQTPQRIVEDHGKAPISAIKAVLTRATTVDMTPNAATTPATTPSQPAQSNPSPVQSLDEMQILLMKQR